MNHHVEIMQHLCRLLAQLYCHHPFETVQLTKSFFRNCLIPAMAMQWQMEEWEFPGYETFYKISHHGKCGNAMKEKLAILYYALLLKEYGGQMNGLYQRLIKLKSLHHTPIWNRFVEEYPTLIKKQPVSQLPKQCNKWLQGLSSKDRQKLKMLMQKYEEKEQKRGKEIHSKRLLVVDQ